MSAIAFCPSNYSGLQGFARVVPASEFVTGDCGTLLHAVILVFFIRILCLQYVVYAIAYSLSSVPSKVFIFKVLHVLRPCHHICDVVSSLLKGSFAPVAIICNGSDKSDIAVAQCETVLFV